METGRVVIGLRDPNLIQDDVDSDESDDETSDDEEREALLNIAPRKKSEILKIDLDIYISAYANARSFYDAKKVAGITKLI